MVVLMAEVIGGACRKPAAYAQATCSVGKFAAFGNHQSVGLVIRET
jgi:hypothetical protein